MNTENEQPVSDTPRTDEIWEEFSTSGHINHDMVFRHARELERRLNQANEKLNRVAKLVDIASDFSASRSDNEIATSATFLEAVAYTNCEMLQAELDKANLYRAELEAVARESEKQRREFPIHLDGCVCPFCSAITALKAKGWKA